MKGNQIEWQFSPLHVRCLSILEENAGGDFLPHSISSCLIKHVPVLVTLVEIFGRDRFQEHKKFNQTKWNTSPMIDYSHASDERWSSAAATPREEISALKSIHYKSDSGCSAEVAVEG